MKFYAEAENGKMILKNKEAFKEFIKTLKGNIVVDIKKVRKTRSLQQNKYYHGVLVKIIADWSGNKCAEVHEYIKAKYLCDLTGKIPRFRSTTELSTLEMNDLWCRVGLDMAFHGVSIPEPNSPDLDNLMEIMDKKFIP